LAKKLDATKNFRAIFSVFDFARSPSFASSQGKPCSCFLFFEFRRILVQKNQAIPTHRRLVFPPNPASRQLQQRRFRESSIFGNWRRQSNRRELCLFFPRRKTQPAKCAKPNPPKPPATRKLSAPETNNSVLGSRPPPLQNNQI
jgi:hypothetical protein